MNMAGTQASENNYLDRRWLEEFGGLLGLRVSDIVGMDGIEQRHLIPYSYPTDEALRSIGATGIFLGYYLPWDGYANALLSQAHGLTTFHSTVEGSVVSYENLDNYQTGCLRQLFFIFENVKRNSNCLDVQFGQLFRNFFRQTGIVFGYEYLLCFRY